MALVNDNYFGVVGHNATDTTSNAMRNGGWMQSELFSLLNLFGKPGIFLDLGANIGAVSLALVLCVI